MIEPRTTRWGELIGEGLFSPYADMMISLGLQVSGVRIRNKQRVGSGTYLVHFTSSIVGPVAVQVHREGQTTLSTYNRSLVITSPITATPQFGAAAARATASDGAEGREGGARAVVSDQPMAWVPVEFLPYVELQWQKIPGAASYLIELLVGAVNRETLARVQDRGDAEYFVWRSFAMVEEDIYAVFITPIDINGQKGPEWSEVIQVVVRPTPENVTFTYDDDPEETKLTVAAAS